MTLTSKRKIIRLFLNNSGIYKDLLIYNLQNYSDFSYKQYMKLNKSDIKTIIENRPYTRDNLEYKLCNLYNISIGKLRNVYKYRLNDLVRMSINNT